ncbi:hypothetical protein GJAV_G00004730 [Gymnothorax javanicus]|nr:hypothetical protein GJAV_G00004730 [Gymnothorax javanicus]
MKIRLVLLCVAVMLTVAVNGCPVGREFLTAFLANFEAGIPHAKLELAITAYAKRAVVRIEVKEISLSHKIRVKKWSTARVRLPQSVEMQGLGASQKTVQITADADISVVAFNKKLASGDSSFVLPSSALGNDYMVYTPDTRPKNMDKLVAIINGKDANKVEIHPKRNMPVKGSKKWKKKDKVTIKMAPYEVYQFRSHKSFTGTRLKASHPVAVMAGHQCSKNGKHCTHVSQQLLPVQMLSKHLLVPVIRKSKDVLHVLAIKDKTKVSFVRGRKEKTKELKTGQTWNIRASGKIPLVLNSNRKIMVMYSSGNDSRNQFFMSILPQSQMSNMWSIDTQASLINTAVIISEAAGIKSIRLNGKKLPKKIKWKQFPADYAFRWTRVPLGEKQRHVKITCDALAAVYVHGAKFSQSYSTAGVCYPGSMPQRRPDPCENVSCKKRHECRKGACVKISKATCRATGDPHYKTLDGKPFDFQGTCTYIMSTTVGNNKGLIPFTILAKNDNRGKKYVSFVRKVTIKVYNQTITIAKRKGIIQVNGVNCHLPVIHRLAAGGKLHVVQRNRNAVLKTDFGLVVSYDWKSKLYITVPSSYSQSVGGLCGNYNGKRKDEFTTREGKKTSSVIEFAKSWKEPDGDVFCYDECRGVCPSCSAILQEKYRSEDFCGLMAKKDGPFASCHNILEPDMFVDNCIYDVCVNKGMKNFLCDNIESYASACSTEGVNLTKGIWREQANCPMDCPVNSHYESCGTACPASCSNLETLEACPEICMEGCQCNKNFVLSGEKCVPKSTCGCFHDGQYFEPGQEYWEDSKCTRRCKCNSDTSKVECSEGSCRKSQLCDLRDGVRDCYPASFATCRASGDPHYETFDKKRFDFQGTCTYYLSKLSSTADPGLVPFEVRVQNENRGGNKRVSFTKTVEITVYENTIVLSKERPGKVLLNGQIKILPFQLKDGKLLVSRRGKYGVVKSDFGLKLMFDWNSHVTLTLPSSYSGDVGGLCGNMNGNKEDDMVKPDNSPAETIKIFGNSWKKGDDPGCTDDCGGGECPKCDSTSESRYKRKKFCGMISNPQGPFKACHSIVDPQPYLEECIYDMCMYSGHASALCNALTTYTTACQDALATVDEWRSDSFCPPSCKENSHYSICATACPFMCSDFLEPMNCEDSSCQEGCVCDNDFALSDGECVPLAECGCMHKGHYYQKGQVFFLDDLCEQRCVCQEAGAVQCTSSFSCGPNEKCQIKDGVQACFPDGTGTCSVFGLSSYLSFDSRAFDFSGNCAYVLAKVRPEYEEAFFSVSVKQESIAGKVPVSRRVGIEINEDKIVFLPKANWEVMVNDEKMNLPLSLNDGNVRVYQNGFYIVLETELGLRVRYDSVSGVFIDVPSSYKGAINGLCGNYNDSPADDLTLPSGLPAPSVEEFAKSWGVVQEGVECQTGTELPCPNPNIANTPEAEKACSILLSLEGPFSSCHGAVPPKKYYEECVLEISSCQPDSDALCRHLQRYMAFCQANGVTVGKWRTTAICPIECPANSHYELCADTCSSTCASLSVSAKCASCQEGCQCDDGFVFDGKLCVPLNSCGCMENGRYYQSGESVVLNDCTEICRCENGVLSCQDTDCADDESCLVKKGVLGCYKDPCAEKKCKETEECILEDNNPICVPQSVASCWVAGDPNYQTFDGSVFGFPGTCSYTLVKTTGKDNTLPAFNIETTNGLHENGRGSFVKSVLIKLLDHKIYIPYMEHGKVLIDGTSSPIPVTLEFGRIEITLLDKKGSLKTNFGVEVVFDWISELVVTVNSNYYNNLAGLCGSYNDVQEDDFTTPAGKVVVNSTEWGRFWAIDTGDPFCWHSCQGACPVCSDEDLKLYRNDKYCGLLLKKDGPFNQCHSVVAPEKFASNCSYNMCLNNGGENVFCEAYLSYHKACKDAGYPVSCQEPCNC